MLMNIDMTATTKLPPSFFIIGMVLSVVLAGIFSVVYFKGKGVKASTKEGFYLGVTIILIGFVLDLVLFLLSILAGETGSEITTYYSNIFFWIALVLVIATATLVGALRARK